MNNQIATLIEKMRKDERGLSTVEYVVLLVLIVALAAALWSTFGNRVSTKLTGASDTFNDQVVQTPAGN